MPVISRNAPQRSVLCILDPRCALRREGLRAISLRTRGHDSDRLDSARLRSSRPTQKKRLATRRQRDVFATAAAASLLLSLFHSISPLFSLCHSLCISLVPLCGHFDSSRRHLVRSSASSTVTTKRAVHFESPSFLYYREHRTRLPDRETANSNFTYLLRLPIFRPDGTTRVSGSERSSVG